MIFLLLKERHDQMTWGDFAIPPSGLYYGRQVLCLTLLLTLAWVPMMVVDANFTATAIVNAIAAISLIATVALLGHAATQEPSAVKQLTLAMPCLLLLVATGGVFVWAGVATGEWGWWAFGAAILAFVAAATTAWLRAHYPVVRRHWERQREQEQQLRMFTDEAI